MFGGRFRAAKLTSDHAIQYVLQRQNEGAKPATINREQHAEDFERIAAERASKPNPSQTEGEIADNAVSASQQPLLN